MSPCLCINPQTFLFYFLLCPVEVGEGQTGKMGSAASQGQPIKTKYICKFMMHTAMDYELCLVLQTESSPNKSQVKINTLSFPDRISHSWNTLDSIISSGSL